jgi:hypothetical protein
VSPGTRGGFISGLVFVGLGPVMGIIGASVLIVASNTGGATAGFAYGNNPSYSYTPPDNSSGKTAGAVLVGVGIGLAILGGIMAASNAHTGVSQTSGAPKEAWLRKPTWREDPTASALPKALGVPLWSASF